MSNNTVEIAIRLAIDQFKTAVGQLETAFGGAMSKVEAESAVAGGALEEAFKTLGVSSVASVEAEVKKLQVAIGLIRNMPGVLPADAERATQAFNARIAELRGQVNGVPPAAKNMTAAVNETSVALGNAAHKALAWAGAIAGVGGITELAKKVIETGSAFEQLEGRLTSLLGSQEAAAEAFAKIKEIAATTPFEIAGITDAYAKLTAFGLKPSEDQMRAMLDTAASLGGGTQMLERVTLALGQAWTKGKLQGGEIMQMAEAGVPVWDLLAQATGRNVAELQKMSEAGLLGRDAISALIDEMGRQNMGASATLMDTYAGAVSNAKDAISEFFAMISNSGVLDYLKTQIQTLLAEFDRMKQSGELEQKAKQIADAFLNFAEGVKTALSALQSLSGVIRIALEALAVQKVLSFASALRGMAAAATTAGAAAVVATGQTAALGTAAATASVGVGKLAMGLRLLKGLTLVGLAEGAVHLAGKFFAAKRAAEEADAAVERMLAEKPAPVKKQVETVTEAANEADAAVSKLAGRFGELIKAGKDVEGALSEMMKALDVADMPGIKSMALALNQLAAEGRIAAWDIQAAWSEAIGKLAGEDLLAFMVTAKAAFTDSERDVAALATVMDAVLRKAIADTGQDFTQLTTGMSADATQAVAMLDVMVGSMDAMQAAGVNAAAAIEGALVNALAKASNSADLDAVKARMSDLGLAGEQAGRRLRDAFADAQRRIEDMEPGIQSVEEAFRRLGIKSTAELRRTADEAGEAFAAIRDSGQATSAQIEDAFVRYAEAAIAANGGVADTMIQVRAEMLGLTVQTGEAGDKIARAAEETKSLKTGLEGAAEEAERVAQNADAAAKSMTKAAQSQITPEAGALFNKGKGDAGMLVHTRGSIIEALKRYGVEMERAIELSKEFTDESGRVPFINNAGQAKYAGRGWDSTLNTAIHNLAMRELDARPSKQQQQEQQQRKQTAINLTIPGAKDPVPVFTDPHHADLLVQQLRNAGAVTYR